MQGVTLVLDRVDTSNDRFDLQARLRLRGQNRRGCLYARWGMLSVGVQADGAQNQFHLLRAKQWYDAPAAVIAVTGSAQAIQKRSAQKLDGNQRVVAAVRSKKVIRLFIFLCRVFVLRSAESLSQRP